jgi:predicted phosphodiesterase
LGESGKRDERRIMPISLVPVTRREVLRGSLAVGIGLVMGRLGWGAGGADGAAIAGDPNRVALLSDTHIAANIERVDRGVHVAKHLRTVVAEVKALLEKEGGPGHVFVNGDIASRTGELKDYENFLDLMGPLAEAKGGRGVPIHLTIGNHDHRERMWKSVPHEKWSVGTRVKSDERHMLIVETPRADWVILDTLDELNKTPGIVGEMQLKWLAGVLDAPERKGRNVIVMMHHYPKPSVMYPVVLEDGTEVVRGGKNPEKTGGAVDSPALMEILLERKQVKALVFGHTHDWNHREQEGLHLVNLPAVAYVFKEGQVSGWVDWVTEEKGARLELRCVKKGEKRHGEIKELRWR